MDSPSAAPRTWVRATARKPNAAPFRCALSALRALPQALRLVISSGESSSSGPTSLALRPKIRPPHVRICRLIASRQHLGGFLDGYDGTTANICCIGALGWSRRVLLQSMANRTTEHLIRPRDV